MGIAPEEHLDGAFKQGSPVGRLSHEHRHGEHEEYNIKKTGKTWLFSPGNCNTIYTFSFHSEFSAKK